MALLFDGAEDWDLDIDCLTPRKETKPVKAPTTPRKTFTPDTCTRCSVESLADVPASGKNQKTLVVRVEPGGESRFVYLRDDWTATDIRIGDIVNIIGTFETVSPSSSSITSSITITSKSNYLILHPDILLTATALSNAPQCRRKPLLSGMMRSSTDVTPALVWGNMLHEVMQACLSSGRWEARWIQQKISDVVQKGLSELVKLDTTIEQAHREMTTRAKGLSSFSAKYMAQTPKPNAVLTNTRAVGGQDSLLAVAELLDVEEDIWSPTYGLKGKLDATVQAVISDPNPPFSQRIVTSGPQPFEIKTGRAIAGMEHRAQTMLYTLLASERYGVPVPSGLLYYTQSEEVVRVPVSRNELRGLIVARNELAGYTARRHKPRKAATLHEERFLPPTIDDERICKRCFTIDSCMLYRKAVENVVDTTSPIADVYELKTSHLTPAQSEFFKKWEALITLEEQDLARFKKELWTLGAAERELKGRCFGSMVLDTSYSPTPSQHIDDATTEPRIHRFTYRFTRAVNATGGTLLNGHLNEGDPITVSVDPGVLALARGFILNMTPYEILCLITLRKRLKPFQPPNSQHNHDEIIFRIDKDEFSGGMGRIRDNLAQLFYADGDTARLELVVDLRAPVFDETHGIPTNHSARLNINQQQALTKVLSAKDYALILGMPGTGKTTVIAAIIRTLVSAGQTVLLTSYTHSAVDTVLGKLSDADFSILRLGNVDKIRPDIQKYSLAARKPATTIEQLEHQLMTPPVVATTCLSLDQGGLDVSLFRRLSDAHPNAVVDLAYQYRMNEDIMLLSNKLIYSDRLRCGSELVAQQSLVLPNTAFLKKIHSGAGCQPEHCWLERLMAPSCKAVFVDTDNIPASDSRVGDLVQNVVEAELVRQVTEILTCSGIRDEQVGIISLYRQQVKLLTHTLQNHPGVEILTADRSQGRDKDCIIISLVRSNDSAQVGDLVKDWRRMNVSFTRARSKLIIFGSRKTLGAAPLLAEFFTLMESQGWILRLPPKADLMHKQSFDDSSHAKRVAEGAEPEIDVGAAPKETKKPRLSSLAAHGMLKGRPILKDLIHENI
ncbi:DNA replication factor Dna2-domain-containing protein [Infundibulicybe gibba]|nr:DNA replication factor Dna2-domain-containing protein [Infundibulicybe gibba]